MRRGDKLARFSVSKASNVSDSVSFIFARPTDEETKMDPDKHMYMRSNAEPKVQYKIIDVFEGDNSYLSPTYPCHVYLGDYLYPFPSYEHALQAAKFLDFITEGIVQKLFDEIQNTGEIRKVKILIASFIQAICNNKLECSQALKDVVKNGILDTMWNTKCNEVAEILLRDKFVRSKEMTRKLAQLGDDVKVQYLNTFGDQYWGVIVDTARDADESGRKGKNWYGVLLAKLRTQILDGVDIDLWLKHRFAYIAPINDANLKCKVEVAGIKDSDVVEVQEFYGNKLFFGKDKDLCEVLVLNPSVSGCHGVIVVCTKPLRMIPAGESVGDNTNTSLYMYYVDLSSVNGSFVNDIKIAPYVPTLLNSSSVALKVGPHTNSGSCLRLGASTRNYRLRVSNAIGAVALIRRDPSYEPASQAESKRTTGGEDRDLTVYVGNLPYDISESDVREYFGDCGGRIMSISVPRSGNGIKGFAFITFDTLSAVSRALGKDGDEKWDRRIFVKRSKQEKGEGRTRSGIPRERGEKRPREDSNSSYYQRTVSERDKSRSRSADSDYNGRRGRSPVRERDRVSRRSRSRSADSDYNNR